MIVLKIIGFVLLAVIALIVLLLSVKVNIFAEYSDVDTNVRIRWLFLNIPLYPSSKKEKKEKPDKKKTATEESSVVEESELPEETAVEETASETETAPEEQPEQPGKKGNSFLKTLYNAHGIDGLLLILRRLFRYLGTFFGDLMSAVVIDELYLDVMCNKNDAASTAIYYGEVCSALFPMLGALVTKYKVRKYDINVYPDYLARHSSASFAVNMHLYPIFVVGISISLVMKLVFKVVLKLLIKCFLPSKNKGNENIETDKEESVA